jgi:phosphomannomutase
MVTASHNPPADNGYKVYAHNGAQIIPPHDDRIAHAMQNAPAANAIARLAPPDAAREGLRFMIGDDVERTYLDAVHEAGWHRPKPTGLPVVYDAVPLRIVYTAMHGVGHRKAVRALARAGFSGIVDVTSQVDPDGTFRTVAFPNPEEKGALDRAFALANEVKAELVLANDPDADRLAVAIPDDKAPSGYRALSGNEIGVLLCWDALAHAPVHEGQQKLVVTSIVSSTWLSRIARDYGAAYEEVLTGFKWIANKAIELSSSGKAFVAGYEEALGYSVGPLVRDKDGISAAVRMAELVRSLRAKGMNLWQKLDELAVLHGLSHGRQWSVTMPGLTGMQRIQGVMSSLRQQPLTMLDDENVAQFVDLARATQPADVLVFHSASGARLTVRPSGTEPKIKFYLELVARVSSSTELAAARAVLDAKAARIQSALQVRLGL